MGNTQPQGEPKGAAVNGSTQIWSQPTEDYIISTKFTKYPAGDKLCPENFSVNKCNTTA